MNEMVNLLKGLLFATLLSDTAIFTVLLCINSTLSDITKLTKEQKEQTVCNKELAYTVICIGKKPCSYHSITKWFTVDKQYTVYKLDESYLLVYDDDGTEWRVSQYDKLMLEAGGYLFGRAKEEGKDNGN